MHTNTKHHFRHARLLDINVLMKMWQAIDKAGEPRPFGGDSSEKKERTHDIILHTLKSSEASIWVCCVENTIIGTIAGHIYQKPAVNLTPVGVIYSLWVEPEYRKQSVAKQLLRYLEDELTELGALALQVGWDKPNNRAEEWWQKRGYSPYEVIASKAITKRRS